MAKLFLIVAPSATGKTTLVHEVCAQLQSSLVIKRVITYTTRSPRPEEKEGEDYYFVTPEWFKQKIEQQFFIECSLVYGHWYGTSADMYDVLNKSVSLILIVDIQGMEIIRTKMPSSIAIWIDPPAK